MKETGFKIEVAIVVHGTRQDIGQGAGSRGSSTGERRDGQWRRAALVQA